MRTLSSDVVRMQKRAPVNVCSTPGSTKAKQELNSKLNLPVLLIIYLAKSISQRRILEIFDF